MSIKISWEFTLEDIAEMFKEGTQERRWIEEQFTEESESDFGKRLESLVKGKVGVNTNVDGAAVVNLNSSIEQVVKIMMRRYLKEMEADGELERDGDLDDSWGDIGANKEHRVQNHSAVRVLPNKQDREHGLDCAGWEGVIEAFNYEDVPQTVMVQFPDEDGEYSGEVILKFYNTDIEPVEASDE